LRSRTFARGESGDRAELLPTREFNYKIEVINYKIERINYKMDYIELA